MWMLSAPVSLDRWVPEGRCAHSRRSGPGAGLAGCQGGRWGPFCWHLLGEVQGRHVYALHSHTDPLQWLSGVRRGSALCRLLCASNVCVGGCERWEGESEWGCLRNKCSCWSHSDRSQSGNIKSQCNERLSFCPPGEEA